MANSGKFEEKSTWGTMETPKMMERMQNLFETSKWHDCVFKLWKSDGTGEELVFAHNLILASSSPVFEALCYGPLAEENPIEVPDVDPLAFRMMLKYIYTDSVEFNSVEMACNVLYASKKYLINSLAILAISHILVHINESNCLQVYSFASFVQEDDLIKESWSFLCSHLDDVLKYITYESLSTDLVKNLVNEEALNGNEIIVYKICFMWAEAECKNNNIEKNSGNLRKVLIKAGILNKIRWLTLTQEEFEEGPKKSGILTDEEIKFISKGINVLSNSLESRKEEIRQLSLECKIPKFNSSTESNVENIESLLFESNFFPFSISNNFQMRKKIQLKKLYCHRFVEREIRLASGIQSELKLFTYITANKSVRLTAIFLNAKILPIPQLNPAYGSYCLVETNYNEKVFLSICDNNEKTLFSVLFVGKVSYGTVFKISLKNPVTLERSKEYKIQVDLLNSPDNYLLGVRNSISKFPTGLSITFKDKTNLTYGKFLDNNDLSIITGLELCM